MTQFQRIAAVIVSVGTTVSAVLAAIINLAPTVSIPAPEVAIIITASSIVAAIVNEAATFVTPKVAAALKRNKS